MKTMFTFFMILTALSLILNLGGVVGDNELGITRLVLNILQGNDLTSSDLWNSVLLLAGALATAVGINTFTAGNSAAGITVVKTAAFMIFIPQYIGDYLALINKTKIPAEAMATASGLDIVVFYIVTIIGGLLLIGYILSLVEYLFEND